MWGTSAAKLASVTPNPGMAFLPTVVYTVVYGPNSPSVSDLGFGAAGELVLHRVREGYPNTKTPPMGLPKARVTVPSTPVHSPMTLHRNLSHLKNAPPGGAEVGVC